MTIPGLEKDKLDLSISVRNVKPLEYYIGYEFRGTSGGGDIDIVTGFRPKWVHLRSFYRDRTEWSDSDIVENKGQTIITTTAQANELTDKIFIGSSTTTEAVYIIRGDDDTRRRTMFINFNNDGFTLSHGLDGTAPTGIHIFAMG